MKSFDFDFEDRIPFSHQIYLIEEKGWGRDIGNKGHRNEGERDWVTLRRVERMGSGDESMKVLTPRTRFY